MTINEQVLQIRDALATWAQEQKGRVEIAGDGAQLFSLLATSPGALRAVILFDAETKRGDYEENAGVDRKFLVVVSRGRGFQLSLADNLTTGSAGGAPLFDLVEQAREIIRAQRFETGMLEPIPDYKGTTRTQFEGLPATDAYQIEFTLGTQLPILQ